MITCKNLMQQAVPLPSSCSSQGSCLDEVILSRWVVLTSWALISLGSFLSEHQ